VEQMQVVIASKGAVNNFESTSNNVRTVENGVFYTVRAGAI
jgi:hypothetical protein